MDKLAIPIQTKEDDNCCCSLAIFNYDYKTITITISPGKTILELKKEIYQQTKKDYQLAVVDSFGKIEFNFKAEDWMEITENNIYLISSGTKIDFSHISAILI